MFDNIATVLNKDTLIVKSHSKVDEDIQGEIDWGNNSRSGPFSFVFHKKGRLKRREESVINDHEWCNDIPE